MAVIAIGSGVIVGVGVGQGFGIAVVRVLICVEIGVDFLGHVAERVVRILGDPVKAVDGDRGQAVGVVIVGGEVAHGIGQDARHAQAEPVGSKSRSVQIRVGKARDRRGQ